MKKYTFKISDVNLFVESMCPSCSHNNNPDNEDIINMEVPLTDFLNTGIPICSECGEDLNVCSEAECERQNRTGYTNEKLIELTDRIIKDLVTELDDVLFDAMYDGLLYENNLTIQKMIGKYGL